MLKQRINEMVKLFEMKRVMCPKKECSYAFQQCGHRCDCQICFKNEKP